MMRSKVLVHRALDPVFPVKPGNRKQTSKKEQKAVAGSPTCTNLFVPQRKTRAEKKKKREAKAARFSFESETIFQKTADDKVGMKVLMKLSENRRLNCALRAKVRRCLWFKQAQSI
ncbi:MAG: hypothetical protein ACO1TE_23135, partial [Prosthecobacter sp.]